MEREAHGGKGARAQWFGLWPRTRPCEAEHLGAFFYYSAHMLAGPCLHTAPAGKQPTRLVVAYPAGTPLCTARVDSDSSPDRSVPAGTLAAACARRHRITARSVQRAEAGVGARAVQTMCSRGTGSFAAVSSSIATSMALPYMHAGLAAECRGHTDTVRLSVHELDYR
jgi:hypothetical protein